MERLTNRRSDGSVETTGMEYSEFHMEVVPCSRGNDKYDVRLAEYEDTGLSPEEVSILRAQIEQAQEKTKCCMGVGDGSGNLFVYSDYESIKAAQAIVLLAEQKTRELEQAQAKINEIQTELEEGDYWMKRAKAYEESGGCPICFCSDEEGHKPGEICHEWISATEQTEARNQELEKAYRLSCAELDRKVEACNVCPIEHEDEDGQCSYPMRNNCRESLMQFYLDQAGSKHDHTTVFLKEQNRKMVQMVNDVQVKKSTVENELQIMTACRDHWKTSYEELKEQLEKEERSHLSTIDQRDAAEEWADKLAYIIGGEEIGEHSSCNNPWENALEAAEEYHAQLAQSQSREAGYRDALEYLAANRDGKFDCSECPASPCGGLESCHQEIANKALASPGSEVGEEVKRLRTLFDDIYPMIAGRVIQLKEAGEEKSAAQWNEICQRMQGLKVEKQPFYGEPIGYRVERFLQDKKATLARLEQKPPANTKEVAAYREGLIDEVRADIARLELILGVGRDGR